MKWFLLLTIVTWHYVGITCHPVNFLDLLINSKTLLNLFTKQRQVNNETAELIKYMLNQTEELNKSFKDEEISPDDITKEDTSNQDLLVPMEINETSVGESIEEKKQENTIENESNNEEEKPTNQNIPDYNKIITKYADSLLFDVVFRGMNKNNQKEIISKIINEIENDENEENDEDGENDENEENDESEEKIFESLISSEKKEI